MNLVIISLLIFSATSSASAFEARYDNYKVYSITPETKEQLEKIYLLEHSDTNYDFWTHPSTTNISFEIMVPPHSNLEFQDFLWNLGLTGVERINNVQRLIDENKPKTTSDPKQYDWNHYYRIEEINNWLDEIASKHDQVAKIITVGHSYEGRALKGLKISFKQGNKAVFIEGGIHAREWIAPATVTYIANEILSSNDSTVRNIAESFDWYIVPSVNPDGYVHTFNLNRLWRKTRKPYGLCRGADANRNWDFHWNTIGTSYKCFEFYAGSFPFSEPEMKSLSEYITSVAKDLVAYISLHSFGQLLLIPYSHGEECDNFSELLDIGKKAITSLEKRHGTKFTVGNWATTLYPSSGVSVDWVKSVHKVPFTYTFELRDTGRYGFLLPSKNIIPVGEEMMDALITIFQEIQARGY